VDAREDGVDEMGFFSSKLDGLWVDSLSSTFFVICLALLPTSVTEILFSGAYEHINY
jgi:hypothetical protein